MQISRRGALMGATAAAVVTGVVTAPLAMQSAGVKAALAGDPVIALAAQVKAAYRAHVEAYDAYEDIAHDAGYNTSDDHATAVGTTVHGERYSWGRDQLLEAARWPEHYRARITPEERDRALAAIETNQRKAATARRNLGLDPLKNHAEQCRTLWYDLEERMLDMPARTVAGVLAKMQSWYGDDEIEAMREDETACDGLPVEYTASIYRDLERLAEEAQS